MSSKTLTSWALLIWKYLQQEQLDAAAIFKQAGLDVALLSDNNARYPVTGMYKLWRAAVAATNDHAFGFRVGKEWSSTTFNALGFAWLASSSLKEALYRLQRYSKLVNNGLVTQFYRSENVYIFKFDTHDDHALIHPCARDAWLTAIIKMIRLLVGEEFKPEEILLSGDNYERSGAMENYIGCPLIYQQPINHIVLAAAICEQQLLTADPELALLSEQLLMTRLQQVDNTITSQVRRIIHQELPNGELSEQVVADRLHMSSRSLQRKLNDEQTSYQLLLTDERKNLALSYIRSSQLSLNEIGYLLGFNNQANFTRAFKSWFSQSPTDYRQTSQRKVNE
ncbi:MAG TPA: AraC family transcriptional regulator [Cellvibrio sp.]|nr:AraC family transcriptional regulator [Cellvibrio sp.]